MDSSTLVSAIGICCALAGMAVLIFKRVTPVIIGPLAAVLVCLTSKIPVFSGLTETYLSGVAGFFTSYVFIFLLGNISAPISFTCSGLIALTVACVPTGIKTGVCISP